MDYLMVFLDGLRKTGGRSVMPRALRIPEGFPNQRRVVVPPDVVARCARLPIAAGLHLLSIGSYPAAAHHYFERPQGLDAAILIHCIGGRGWCRIGRRKWRVGPGQAILLPPGVPHAYAADRDAPWSIHWLHFGGHQAEAYLAMLGVGVRQPLLHLDASGTLQAAFEELFALCTLGYTDGNVLMVSADLARFLTLFRVHQRAFYRKGRLAEEKIRKSMDFMRNHLEEPLALDALAGQAHMSVPHYCAVFKRQTNTSPILFLIRLKMQRACELLAGTDLPVAAIGRRVGHQDPFYFCRVFKKTIGMSPSAYRRAEAH